MSKLDRQFIEDRALRNSARAVIMADIAHAKTTLSAKGFADRVGGRIGDGAKDVFEVAKVHSEDNRGIIAALIGAVLLWLAREPIMEILGLDPENDDAGDEFEDEAEGIGAIDDEDADAPMAETSAAEDDETPPTPAQTAEDHTPGDDDEH